MMTVVATLAFSCGCTEAVVDDDGRLVACSADVCRGHWWCECRDGQADPDVCEHAEALLLALDVA
jgi:SWIM zinc finger